MGEQLKWSITAMHLLPIPHLPVILLWMKEVCLMVTQHAVLKCMEALFLATVSILMEEL